MPDDTHDDSKAPPHTVFLGLGTNLGDRRGNLTLALDRLRRVMRVEAVSSIYDTAPVGITDQPRFLNAVVRGSTGLDPSRLLRRLLRIEASLGRRRTGVGRGGPRPIDIDLLLYDDLVICHPDGRLQVPHPRLHERAFVLVPLAEIAPDWVHPVLGRTVARIAAQVDRSDVERWGDLFGPDCGRHGPT